VRVVVVASDSGRPSTEESDGSERIDGGDSSFGDNSGYDYSDGYSSGEIQEI